MTQLTPEQLRALDRATRELFGLPTLLLMEHASLAVAMHARGMVGRNAHVLALCGTGNNGGDSAAAARHLFNAGYQVQIWLVGRLSEAAEGDHVINLRAAQRIGVQFHIDRGAEEIARAAASADLVLDGLVGTGLKGPLRAPMLEVVEALSNRHPRSLAIDIPSGLSGLTGEPMPVALPAERTVTLGFSKVGFRSPAAQAYLGELVIADIGYPRPILEDPLRYAGGLDGPQRAGP